MKTKKIRGHRRKWKEIELWVESKKHLDIDYLKHSQRDYTKIRVHPWSGISLNDWQPKEPNGKTKSKMLEGLFEIYESWDKQLKQLNVPYYLKIWLYEPRFSNSQVVCAIGEFLDFYEITFFKPDQTKKLNHRNYGNLSNSIETFDWEYRLDEDHFNNTEIGNEEDYWSAEDYLAQKKWFEKKLKKPHRKLEAKQPTGEITEYYSFKQGVVWLGEKSKDDKSH